MSDLLDVRINTDNAAHLASNSCDLQGCRRLVLIDPEDFAQVERLMAAFETQRGESLFSSDDGHMQDALRALAEAAS